jgi:hypothetical protein
MVGVNSIKVPQLCKNAKKTKSKIFEETNGNREQDGLQHFITKKMKKKTEKYRYRYKGTHHAIQ